MVLPKFTLPNLKNPLWRRRVFIYLLMAAAVLVVFSVGMIGATGFPRGCNIICHSMDPEYNTWKKSAHANIGCVACHTAPGGAFTKIAEDIFVNVPIGVKQFVGFEKPINPHSEISQEHMENERCLRCHSPQTREFTSRPDLKMGSQAHQKHLKRGLSCTTCHNRVAHKGAEKFEPITRWEKGFQYQNFTTMKEGCFRCHSMSPRPAELAPEIRKLARKTSIACPVCHPRGWQFLPSGHGNDWRKAHVTMANADLNSCLRCHPKKACNECHRREEIRIRF